MSRVILITGCSTGIGRDLAEHLTQSGYMVVATARNVETLKELPATLKLSLDVTQPESIRQVVSCTLSKLGRIDVLVNNAGYALPGALEEVSDEQTQAAFEVNVFGALRMIRAVLPQMRRQGSGRIINISSIAGKLSTPGNGTYSGTKFALEGMSDALRHELAPFGIQVVVVEPGAIQTHFDETAQAQGRGILADTKSPYQALYKQSEQFAASMRQNQAHPEAVSRVIERAIRETQPRARYLAGVPFTGRMVISLRDLIWSRVLNQMFDFNLKEFQS